MLSHDFYRCYLAASDAEHSFMINNVTGSITTNRNLSRTTHRLIVTVSTFMDRTQILDSFNSTPQLVIYTLCSSQGRKTKSSKVLQLVCLFQAATSHHPPAFALVVINVGALPNRTFEASVMENEANTVVFDLKVCVIHVGFYS